MQLMIIMVTKIIVLIIMIIVIIVIIMEIIIVINLHICFNSDKSLPYLHVRSGIKEQRNLIQRRKILITQNE